MPRKKLLRRIQSLKIVIILRKEANPVSISLVRETPLLQTWFTWVTWKKLLRRVQSLKIVIILRKEAHPSDPSNKFNLIWMNILRRIQKLTMSYKLYDVNKWWCDSIQCDSRWSCFLTEKGLVWLYIYRQIIKVWYHTNPVLIKSST